MKIGVIGFQGAIGEHVEAIERVIKRIDVEGEAIWLKDKSQLFEMDGIVIPGGESTTIGKLMMDSEIFDKVKELGEEGLPILGTCAGLILLAKKGGEEIRKIDQPLLGLMDMEATRNAFGRQKESFEKDIVIPSLGKRPFPCVFIRAPAIKRVWNGAKTLAEHDGKIILAEQDNQLALAFHPELTQDTRIHEYFLEKVKISKFAK